jgi:hypothetical protein
MLAYFYDFGLREKKLGMIVTKKSLVHNRDDQFTIELNPVR